ncbi:excinuclease ABC subunit UvrA [Myroides sp. DF42-4-2]|uniref:excinuclease ABC subunit UvrA n=1 Tax=unclassified Myroides TaxID=2642485 RepID=UPI002576FD42|nr:excinuclease ABC subunit UvrA [Myroides sp. DF42-4-2]MDM1407483.1 excinuclease ABC subunit UvrA [Myroides sp. DF42-4-2]
MSKIDFSKLDPKKNIIIKGAHLHNLKHIDVVIPRNQMVVVTGLSGSGKSSLAFDTLYAEGQRRYVESLSSYARQFLGRIDKPKVEYIKGIAPAIAIEQKVNTTNARSTVGTSTELYDYIKLLFARIGHTYSPISGQEVKKDTVTDVTTLIKSFALDSKWLLLAPLLFEEERTLAEHLDVLLKQGYARLWVKGEMVRLDEFLGLEPALINQFSLEDIRLIIDRIVVKDTDEFYNRLGDAVETAFFEGKGTCYVRSLDEDKQYEFNNRFELDGITFLEPNIHLFSFNNPYGACPVCDGYGNVIGIDEELVFPNTGLSVYENAVFPWRGESMGWYRDQLVQHAYKFDFPIHRPIFQLTAEEKALLWEGNEYFTGLNAFFEELEEKNYKIQNRVLLSRYRGKTKCPTCKGKRLRKEAGYVKIGGKTVSDLVDMPIDKLVVFFQELRLTDYEQQVAKRLLIEINNRLGFLLNVGLSYLTLNRNSSTLSGGESQRINLATSLGSSLVGSMYILDEPSIGLHPKDGEKLIQVLKQLKALGNTVIVVEHDEEIMQAADQIIDIGPEAGTFGGELVAQGTLAEILQSDSLTAQYLNGTRAIEIPKKRRSYKHYIDIIGAREHNLKNIDVRFPLDCLTVITGVSGSGKSTLVKRILYPALQKKLTGLSDKPGQFTALEGKFDHIKQIEYVDQNPIGRSSRSNPVTYIKAYDEIRDLYAKQNTSKLRGYQPKHFSFNVDGGRCEVCKGEGSVTVEMQFMADVHLECEACHGKRFKKEVLEVNFEGKNIDDILRMTIDDALAFFKQYNQTKIATRLQPLQDVGLGYVQLGQSSSTLSGGEAQRIKLASFLLAGSTREKVLFVFDEPTTGLHFHDINKLLTAFNALIDKGHSILVIEHNLDLIKCADYIVDIGPEGGEKGGQLIAFGTPEEVAACKESSTGQFLKHKLK